MDTREFDPELSCQKLGVTLPASLARAARKRQAEFVAGRFAAREALKAAGCPEPGELAIGADRAPVWPAGFVGSITHAPGFVAAVAASRSQVRALGRDSERLLDDATALEIGAQVLRPDEQAREAASGLSRAIYTSIVFSAKESLYKALAPLAMRFFGFYDAQALVVSPTLVRLRLETDLGHGFAAGTELEARVALEPSYVHTAIELEAGNAGL